MTQVASDTSVFISYKPLPIPSGSLLSVRGKTPKLPYADKQRIVRDVLIARTVKRAGALLVTDNLRDFKTISRYCNVRVISGKDFFFSNPL
jgi:hypothetical protein